MRFEKVILSDIKGVADAPRIEKGPAKRLRVDEFAEGRCPPCVYRLNMWSPLDFASFYFLPLYLPLLPFIMKCFNLDPWNVTDFAFYAIFFFIFYSLEHFPKGICRFRHRERFISLFFLFYLSDATFYKITSFFFLEKNIKYIIFLMETNSWRTEN